MSLSVEFQYAQAVGISTTVSSLQSTLHGRFDNMQRSHVLHSRITSEIRRFKFTVSWLCDGPPGAGWRFADGDGYRSKEPINVSNVPFPILSAQWFPVWKRRTPLLYMFRVFGSPVSWVRSFGASALEIFAPNGLKQAP
jgi:hypothetical protein